MNKNIIVAAAFGSAAFVVLPLIETQIVRKRARHRARQQVGLVTTNPEPKEKLELSLQQTPWLFITPLAVFIAFWLFGVAGMAVAPIPYLTERAVRARTARRYTEQLEAELAPALQLVVGHLRIGRNFVGAITEVADSVPEPLASLLQEVVSETRIGTPIDDVLQKIADRENDRHLSVVASAVGLQSRLGGSLVEILDNVIDTIEEEDRLRRDIRSLTADGRLSAQILMALPPISLIVLSILSPGYAEPLVTEPLGRTMSVAAILLGLTGWRWLTHLSSPKVVA
jgi:tight adherence protein B